MSSAKEYFEYRLASRFIGEIQIVISVILFASGVISIVSFSTNLNSKPVNEREIALGYISYSCLLLSVALIDLVFAFILISGTNKISLQRCLLWRGAAAATLILFGLLTIAFMMMLKMSTVLLAYIPFLIVKPFGMWIVNAFIDEIGMLENFPSATSQPPVKPILSLQNLRQLKRTTTIFTISRNSFGNELNCVVVGSKMRPISEESTVSCSSVSK